MKVMFFLFLFTLSGLQKLNDAICRSGYKEHLFRISVIPERWMNGSWEQMQADLNKDRNVLRSELQVSFF
jgi:hypothetical protein